MTNIGMMPLLSAEPAPASTGAGGMPTLGLTHEIQPTEVWLAAPVDRVTPPWVGRAEHPSDMWLTAPRAVVQLAPAPRLSAPRR
jgi:hypothetical protein